MSLRITSTPAVRAGALWLAASLVYLVTEAITAIGFPHYSYATNFISDLGIPERGSFEGRPIDSTLAWVMNTGFVVHGLLFLLATVFFTRSKTSKHRNWLIPLAAIHTVGIIMVGLIHGSAITAANGMLLYHGLGAALAIFGGNIAIIIGGFVARKLGASRIYLLMSIVIPVVGMVSAIILFVTRPDSPLPQGWMERASVYSIMLWEIITAVALFASRKKMSTAIASH